ncbi:MAG: response regulator, partial [Bacteroidales bacterium]|nr:response regulator [Bacteroidales bacterium]
NNTVFYSVSLISDGRLLMSSTQGLFLYDPVREILLHQEDDEFPFEASKKNITDAFCDSRGNLWLCTMWQGYEMVPQQSDRFTRQSPLVNAMQGHTVASMDTDGRSLWISTQTPGIYNYDLTTQQLRYFDAKNLMPKSVSAQSQYFNNRSYYIFVDSDNDLWISTTPRGLAHMRRKGDGLEVVRYYDLPMIIELNEDKEGTLWVGCYGNSYFSKRKGETHFVEHHLFSNTFSYLACMERLSDGRFATLERGCGLRYINPETQEQTPPVIPDSVLSQCIARNVFLPSALREGRDGRLWIGTVSNGLMCYDPATGSLENIKGVPCEDIASIEIDKEGNLWVSTKYGLSKYNVKAQTFTNYYSADGTGGNEYFDRSSCQLPDGTLLFGGPHGITAFDPLEIPEVQTGTIRLIDLKVHNRLIRPGENQPISKRLDLCDAVRLQHNQNSFSISFSAFDFSEEERFNYQYRLEGQHKNWAESGSSREAFYANLKPGNYTFHVRITNKDRDYVISETSIPVIVSPSLWGTWWARLLYAVASLCVIIYIVRLYRRIRQEKKNRLQSQREKEQEHRINQMNMNFFANVSHEFRTPLTVISGPIGQLCQDPTIGGEQHKLLKVVNRSVTRMLQLVNQMMDFHKLDEDSLCLEVRRQDMVGLLKQVAEFFSVNARDKNITFRTHGLEDVFVAWTDLDKLEKILNNLLGNAMKYTPAGGRVDLSFDVVSGSMLHDLFPDVTFLPDVQYAKIVVADNGPGIPADKREKIFQRYYQLRHTTQAGKSNWGTGIGLYFTHRLVGLHHGYIRVIDNPDGQGAGFCCVIPVSQSAYSPDEISDGSQTQTSLFPIQNEEIELLSEAESEIDKQKPRLVVVDDDVEVIHYLKLLLGKDYRVSCRFDATTALETLRQPDEEVDLVISDVMMPGTSGIQLCQQIKADDQLCHLPVILVTAKNTVQDQVEGLEAGAIAYVTKPFDPQYLQALIKRLLGTRDQTRKALQESTQTSSLDADALSAQDKIFMTELYRLMEEELDNPDMDINRMTELLHISRSKLYYKIKGLTGENPSSFFKTYKLNRAAELIREGKYNLSEISILTGFSTLSHFSSSFKRHFGVSPSEY